MSFDANDMHKRAVDYIVMHERCVLMANRVEDKIYITLTAVQELLYNRFTNRKVLILTSKFAAEHIWLQARYRYKDINLLESSMVIGSSKQKLRALGKKADVYIMNYDAISLSHLKRFFDFDMVVIDELNEFKNYKTKKYRALLSYCEKINRILGITKELTTHSLNDMWAEFYLLDGGNRLEKTYEQFCEKYFFKIITNKGKGYLYEPKNCALEEISKAISDMTFFYPIKLAKMAEEQVSVIYAHLNSVEMTRYLWMKKEAAIVLDNNKSITASGIVALSSKLFQMANGAVYSDKNEMVVLHNRKVDALKEVLRNYVGKNVLIAYWFRHDAERISAVYKDAKILESEQDIDAWNSGIYGMALIHPALKPEMKLFGGGNILIWFSLTWSLHLYKNMLERIADEKQDVSGMVIHIITEGTIDEKIYKTLLKKESNQQDLINIMLKENVDE